MSCMHATILARVFYARNHSNTCVCVCRARPCRATTVKLEQQLRNATKASPPEPQGPRTWANVSVPAATTPIPTSPGASSKSSTLPPGANSRADSSGRRASHPEASRGQARQIPNQLPRGGGGFVSVRKTLENQQKVATGLMCMGDMKKQVRLNNLLRYDLLSDCVPARLISHANTTWPFTHLPCFPVTAVLLNETRSMMPLADTPRPRFAYAYFFWFAQEPAGAAVYTMNSLRSTAPASSTSNAHGAAERLSSSQEAAAPAVYSLVDFIAAPGSKKPSRRKESSERETQGKPGRVWGVEADGSARDLVGTAEERAAEGLTSAAAEAAVDESPGKKSFHQIIEEEEREKKERDEYGDSVWFVSRKPRSTSFEGIVQQQRREERVAEEEREREMDDEMLRLALEISMQEAQQSGQAASSTSDGKGTRSTRSTRVRSSPPGGQMAGRGARRKKAEKPLDKIKESRTPRKHSATTAGKNKSEPRRTDPETRRHAPDGGGGRRRRPKPHHDPRCGAAVNQATRQDREEVKLGTSAP